MKLMKALSAVGSDSASKRARAERSQSLAAIAAPGPGGVPDYFGSDAQLGVQPAAAQVRRHAAGSWRERREQPGSVHRGRQARYDHLSRLRLLRDRAAPVRREDALRPAADHAARLRAGQQGNGRARRTTPSSPTRSTTSARSSSPTRTARCASSSPTSCPSGEAGDLFIPVDESVMGAGEGPDRRQEVHPEPRARSTSTAASPRGSATARRTSGSRPPRRSPRIPSA